MTPRTWRSVVVVALACFSLVGVSITAGAPAASAATAAGFDPGFIISDTQFYDANAMSEAQIQAFLVSKGSVLSNFRGDVASRSRLVSDSTGNLRCDAFQGGTGLAASTMIHRAQVACGISAKVILVTLQKEQGLVLGKTASQRALDRAMGYACPDTAPCAVTSLGFGNQVYMGALQLKTYKASNFGQQLGVRNILFNPEAACLSSPVNVRSYGTAALYNYTPYQPNAAALQNIYGTGDGCSSYGNRNFFVFYSDWFGSPTGVINPVGVLDVVRAGPGAIELAGWAFDYETPDSISVRVVVNGVATVHVAGNARPDVDLAYGGVGPNHGYSISVPVATGGPQQVCVYAVNFGNGVDTLLRCASITMPTGPPIGALDSVSAGLGSISIAGWVLDPDTVESIPVHVYVGSSGTAIVANQARSDIASFYPAYGGAHGYTATIPAPAGPQNVCVYGINIGNGANILLGCRVVTVAGGEPVGVLDVVTVTPGTITTSGWAFDPDTSSSIPVHVYVGSSGYAFVANKSRPDVGAVYKGYGDLHGYSESLSAFPGTHNVCVYGIDIAGSGSNRLLGCRTVTAMSGSPVGVLDYVSAVPGGLSVAGWVYDPDTVASTSVRIEVDGAATSVPADQQRPDVGAIYPAYGPAHGYSTTIATAPGAHEVCVFATNVGPGAEVKLGCRTVTS